MKRSALVLIFAVLLVQIAARLGGTPATTPAVNAPLAGPLDYVCPMHPDERSDKPGFCPRCGMALKLGVQDQSDYSMGLTATPSNIRPGEKVSLRFAIRSPKDGAVVKKFEIVHEKLFHLFVISGDLKYFAHEHPVQQPDGSFVISQVFPKPGMYRIAADVYPTAGSPQLIDETVFVTPGLNGAVSMSEARLLPDMGKQHGENTDVEVSTIPEKPVEGARTLIFFKFNTADGFEKYLGAWAHMIIASDDLIDLIHDHPTIADGGPEMQFSIIFPRARTYRVWVQFQRKGVVNTVAVNIPVYTLEQAEGIVTGR